MKAALLQQSVTSTGAQNWTDPIFNGDAQALLLFGGRATSNNVDAQHGAISVGATDKATAWALSGTNQDGVDTSFADGVMMTTRCYAFASVGVLGAVGEANIAGVSHPSDGLQINWTESPGASFLVNGLLLGGDDIEVACVTGSFTNVGAQTITVNHGLSGEPDVVIAFTLNTSAVASGDSARPGQLHYCAGFYSVQGNSYASLNSLVLDTQANAADANYIGSGFLLGQNNGSSGGLAYQCTLGNFTSTSFDMACNATSNDTLFFLVLRGKNQRMGVQVGIAVTPTSTGAWRPIQNMPCKPSVVLWMPSRMAAANVQRLNDEAGHIGLAASVNNLFGTQQGVTVASDDDGAATIDAHNQISNTKSLLVTTVSGAADFEASVTNWNDDGVTLNVSNAAATQLFIPYCAFGMPTPQSVKQPRTNTLVRM